MECHGHKGAIFAIAYHSDGRRFATSGFDDTVRVWDASTGECLVVLERKGVGGYRSLAFAPGGATLVAGAHRTVDLWDLAARRMRASLAAHKGDVQGLAIDEDGARLVSVGNDKRLLVFDLATGKKRGAFNGSADEDELKCVAFVPGTALLLTGGFKAIKLWDREHAAPVATLSRHEHYVHSVAVSDDGVRAVSGGADRRVVLWDLAKRRVLEEWTHSGQVHAVAFRKGSAQVLALSADGSLLECPSSGGTPKRTRVSPASSMAQSPDGGSLALGGADGVVRLLPLGRAPARAAEKAHPSAPRKTAVAAPAPRVRATSEIVMNRAKLHTQDELKRLAREVGPLPNDLVSWLTKRGSMTIDDGHGTTFELLSPTKMRRARATMKSWIEPKLAAEILAHDRLDVAKMLPFLTPRGGSSFCMLPMQGRSPHGVLLWRHDERGVFTRIAPSFERFMKRLVADMARGEPLRM